ncbi:MAG: metallophosphoesterase, partial [Puniceicoccaceae bacterium]
MSQKIKLLHLSDFHYRNNWHEEIGKVTYGFFKDLEQQVDSEDPPYLVFSGDFVQAGEDESLFQSFIEEFDDKFNALNITKERRIIVPGNHDINRKYISSKQIAFEGIIEQCNSESSFNQYIETQDDGFLLESLENFDNFQQKFASIYAPIDSGTGSGRVLTNDVAIYCLNTAICSVGGINEQQSGKPIDDEKRLMINTRSLNKWCHSNKEKYKILVMHHPETHLREWARKELENIIYQHFDLVLSGHTHEGSQTHDRKSLNEVIRSTAPPLFTRKNENLGYSFITLDTSNGEICFSYRQWSGSEFVLGTALSHSDTGSVKYTLRSAT